MITRTSSGQLIIESIVAVTILVVAIFGIFALVSRSLSLFRVVSDRYTATYLAGEGIEIVKNIVDTNINTCRAWNTGLTDGAYLADYNDLVLTAKSSNNEPLLISDETGLYSYDAGTPTRFYRDITLESKGEEAQELIVRSNVSWTGRGNSQSETRLEDHFFNWRSAPADCTGEEPTP